LISKLEKPLTLALSRRERGLTEVFFRVTPTCATESNSGSEKPPIGSLSPRLLEERGLTEVFCSGQLIPDTSIGGFDAIARS
jgi:hypothetical protein